jgi:hypothetical protein
MPTRVGRSLTVCTLPLPAQQDCVHYARLTCFTVRGCDCSLRPRFATPLACLPLYRTSRRPTSPWSRARTAAACSPMTAQPMSSRRARPHLPNCCCRLHHGHRSSGAPHAPCHRGQHNSSPRAALPLVRCHPPPLRPHSQILLCSAPPCLPTRFC